MAPDAGRDRVPDGQHVALPQFQGCAIAAAALTDDADLYRGFDLPGVDLSAAGPARDRLHIRGDRRGDPRGRHHPPQVPPSSAAARTGASSWLILIAPPLWWALNRCWGATCVK